MKNLVEAMLWLPSYGMCFYHSTHKNQIPAQYEAWVLLENPDDLLPTEGPHSTCHTVCEECLFNFRDEEERGLKGPKLIRMKTLKKGGNS